MKRILLSLIVIGLAVAGIVVWILRGPSPLAFAGGPKVALADYRAGNPTGVPIMESSCLVHRGSQLCSHLTITFPTICGCRPQK